MNAAGYKWIITLLILIIIALIVGKPEQKQTYSAAPITIQEPSESDMRRIIREEQRRHDRLYGPIRP